jgi:protein TonB
VLSTTGPSEPPVEAVTAPAEPARPQPRPQPQRTAQPRTPPREPVRVEPVRRRPPPRVVDSRRPTAQEQRARRAAAAQAAAQRAEAAAAARGAQRAATTTGGRTGAPGGRTGGGGNPADYLSLVRAELLRRHFYPPDAQTRGEQGVATVRMTIGGNGRVGSHAIVRGSGSRSLDLAVAQIMGRVSVPPPPNGSLTVTVPIRWILR